MSLFHVLAIITIKPGQRAAMLSSFNANVPAVLDEDGGIDYEATIDSKNAGAAQTTFGPDTFVVVEKWSSLEKLAVHANSAHMVAYGVATKDMVADRAIHILSPV
jgi:quinol monooxygenase YgiN